MGKKSKQSKEDDTAAATEAVQSEKIKKSSSRARRASRRNDEPAKQDSADSAGSAGAAAAGTSPAPPKDTKGKGKASQDTSAAPKPAASQLSQQPGESLPQGKKVTAPQVSAQSGPPEEASQAEPAAAAPGVTPGHGKHALVTPGDQGDKLSADTAEASPAIGQDAQQPSAAAASGFIKKSENRFVLPERMQSIGTLGKKLGKVYEPIPKKTVKSPTRTDGTSASREVQDLFPDHERTQLNLDGIRDLDLTSTGEINLTSTDGTDGTVFINPAADGTVFINPAAAPPQNSRLDERDFQVTQDHIRELYQKYGFASESFEKYLDHAMQTMGVEPLSKEHFEDEYMRVRTNALMAYVGQLESDLARSEKITKAYQEKLRTKTSDLAEANDRINTLIDSQKHLGGAHNGYTQERERRPNKSEFSDLKFKSGDDVETFFAKLETRFDMFCVQHPENRKLALMYSVTDGIHTILNEVQENKKRAEGEGTVVTYDELKEHLKEAFASQDTGKQLVNEWRNMGYKKGEDVNTTFARFSAMLTRLKNHKSEKWGRPEPILYPDQEKIEKFSDMLHRDISSKIQLDNRFEQPLDTHAYPQHDGEELTYSQCLEWWRDTARQLQKSTKHRGNKRSNEETNLLAAGGGKRAKSTKDGKGKGKPQNKGKGRGPKQHLGVKADPDAYFKGFYTEAEWKERKALAKPSDKPELYAKDKIVRRDNFGKEISSYKMCAVCYRGGHIAPDCTFA